MENNSFLPFLTLHSLFPFYNKCVIAYHIFSYYMILIQKTYQFINVVNGVSHSHKTANIFFSFDSVA